MENKKIAFSVIDPDMRDVPVLSEDSRTDDKKPVKYGEDDKFPQFIKEMRGQSATMGTIVAGFVDYICGDGIDVSPDFSFFAKKINRRGETLEDLINQIAIDYTLYNGFAIQVVYAKHSKRKIAELYGLDFAKLRSNQSGSRFWYLSYDGESVSRAKQYQAFDRDMSGQMEPSQIFYFKNGARTTYPHPMYEGGLKDIMIEAACTDYSLNSVSHGFMARYLLTFPESYNLPDEQKKAIENGIREKFCGVSAPVNFMLNWAQGEKGITVDRIEGDDVVERFESTRKDSRENIYTAFRATPNLFGLPTATTGFNAQEYSQAFKLFQKTVIGPMQNRICQAFDKIFDTTDFVKIKPFTINFE